MKTAFSFAWHAQRAHLGAVQGNEAGAGDAAQGDNDLLPACGSLYQMRELGFGIGEVPALLARHRFFDMTMLVK